MLSGLSILGAKLRKFAAQFPHTAQVLRLLWTAAPRHAVLWTSLLVVQGLVPVGVVYVTRSLVNALVSQAVRPAALLAAGMAALLLVAEVVRVAAAWVRSAQGDLVQDHISSLIQGKSLSVDLAFYDNPDYYDQLHRARSEAGYRPLALLENLGGILQNSITLVSMVFVLARFGVWSAAALLLSTLPVLYVVLKHAVEQYQLRQRITSDERRTWYYDWLLTAPETAAEIRLFNTGPHFQEAFENLRSILRSLRLRLASRQAVSEILAGLCSLAAVGGAMAWMGLRVLRKEVSLGDLAMLFQAFQQGTRLGRSLLDNLGQLYANTLFLGNLFEFLSLEPRVRSASSPVPLAAVRDGIRFRNVSFRYPGTRQPALDGLNLDIPAGRITAVVGSNGAGKSTLIKLLCRFYDPDTGAIEIDGTDLRLMDLKELRTGITVLFQQPVHYNATAAENIALGDICAGPARSSICVACEAAGAAEVVERLPDGYDQLLGRWFENGTELSAGEWQRIALARAFLRSSPIVVLDEPTSSMDPWAETDWLQRFRQLTAGRTALVITHRFSTARVADTIYVVSEGKVAECGSHESLVNAGGRYAEGWAAQNRDGGNLQRMRRSAT